MSTSSILPRGIRNNNPGNIDRDGTAWDGLAPDQSSDPRFCVFTSAIFGIRALEKVLMSYKQTHGLRTLRGMIGRWAPAVENNTSAYLDDVVRRSGFGPDVEIDIQALEVASKVVPAIIAHENAGYSYPAETISSGLLAAGVDIQTGVS
jgi:hypothetical protein